MFQAELYTMTRREQLRDLVRDAARRQQAKEAGSSHSLGIVKHALIVLPLFVAIAGAVVTYLL